MALGGVEPPSERYECSVLAVELQSQINTPSIPNFPGFGKKKAVIKRLNQNEKNIFSKFIIMSHILFFFYETTPVTISDIFGHLDPGRPAQTIVI